MPERVEILSPRIALVRGRHGVFLVNRHDTYLGKAMMTYGEYSEQECAIITQLVEPGATVIEVGAHVGLLTIPLARAVAPGAVLAIEPQPEMFHLLCANTALNAPGNIRPLLAACGRAPGVMALPAANYDAEGNFGGVALQAQGPIQTQIIRLDDLDLPGIVGLVKIDVEGMEAEVIGGAQALIAKHRPVLYVENDRPEKSAALITATGVLGYRMWWHYAAMFNPANHFGAAQDSTGGKASCNMICIPAERPTELTGFPEVSGTAYHPFAPSA